MVESKFLNFLIYFYSYFRWQEGYVNTSLKKILFTESGARICSNRANLRANFNHVFISLCTFTLVKTFSVAETIVLERLKIN